jgi:hypothetical protein
MALETVIRARVDDDLAADLGAFARAHEMTESDALRILVRRGFAAVREEGAGQVSQPPASAPLKRRDFTFLLEHDVETLSSTLARMEATDVDYAVQGARAAEASIRRWAWSRTSPVEALASAVDAVAEVATQHLAEGDVTMAAKAWTLAINAVNARAEQHLAPFLPKKSARK